MSTAYADPDSDIATPWNVCTYTKIADGVRQPTAPGTGAGSFNFADANDDSEEAIQGVSRPVTSGTASEYKVWVYCGTTGSGFSLEIRLKLSTTGWLSAQGNSVGSNSWISITYSGRSDNLASDYPIEIGRKTPLMGKSDDLNEYAAYVEITYTGGGGTDVDHIMVIQTTINSGIAGADVTAGAIAGHSIVGY